MFKIVVFSIETNRWVETLHPRIANKQALQKIVDNMKVLIGKVVPADTKEENIKHPSRSLIQSRLAAI